MRKPVAVTMLVLVVLLFTLPPFCLPCLPLPSSMAAGTTHIPGELPRSWRCHANTGSQLLLRDKSSAGHSADPARARSAERSARLRWQAEPQLLSAATSWYSSHERYFTSAPYYSSHLIPFRFLRGLPGAQVPGKPAFL